MKPTHFITIFFLGIFSFSYSQLKTITNETAYPFWIHVPEAAKTEKQPILIFLHGKSLSGTDLNRVKRYGVLKAMEKGRKIPAIGILTKYWKYWNMFKKTTIQMLVEFMFAE
jgi:predicted peptidase